MFGIGTFSLAGGEGYPGLVVGDRVVDLRVHLGESVTIRGLLESGPRALEQLRTLAAAQEDPGRELTAVRPLSPVEPAGQVFCAGSNYYQHALEMTFASLRDRPDETRSDETLWHEATEAVPRRGENDRPFMFAGLSSALSGATDDVVLWAPGLRHDWELELAVVIGTPARDVTPEQAMDHVAGYTICNDISTRDVMFRPGMALSDFMMSKLRPSFFPTGPYIVPREFVPDYRALRMTLKVNGETMQDATPADMVFGVEELVAYASSVTELAPGDLVLTGSPAGNAAIHGNRWLRPGDVIDAEITGLGAQRNVCAADPRTETREE